MHELYPIIRRTRRPLNGAPVTDSSAQLRAKCVVLEEDNVALRDTNAKLAAECEALRAKHPFKLTKQGGAV